MDQVEGLLLLSHFALTAVGVALVGVTLYGWLRHHASRRIQELKQERQQLLRLNAMLTGSLGGAGVRELGPRLLAVMMEVAGAETGVMVLTGSRGLQLIASQGLSDTVPWSSLASTGLLAKALGGERPCVDSRPAGRLLGGLYSTTLDVRHQIALPMRATGDTVGAVILGRSGPVPFSKRLEQWLELATGQAALAIRNGLVTERLERGVLEVDRLKAELISTVSHELRTPLTSIQGYVNLVLDGDAGPVTGEQREYLTVVLDNSIRLGDLISDLLDAQQLEDQQIDLRRDQVDIREVLQQVARSFQSAAAQKGLDLQLRLEADQPCTVGGDRSRLVQAFSNLVSNAIKYTQNGAVTLTLALPSAGKVEVAVTDTGRGVDSEDIPRLFTKFFRVDNRYTRKSGGMGLGLTIVQGVVEQHGGQIRVDSLPGVGTTFHVMLPLAAPLRPEPSVPFLQ